MTDFDPLPPLIPGEDQIATIPVSFSFPFSDMALPGVGGGAVTVQRFLMVPEAIDIFRTYFCFDANAQFGGVMTLTITQEIENGVLNPITSPSEPFTEASRDPYTLERSSARIVPQRTLFLSITATPDGSGTSPWWTTATRISGTMHIYATE